MMSPESITTARLAAAPALERLHEFESSAVEHFDSFPAFTKRQFARLRTDTFNIMVLYNGGTIGMKRDSEGHLVPTDKVEEVARPFKLRGIAQEINPIWFPVSQHAIDSTNARWPHWVTMGNAIHKVLTQFPDEVGGINGIVSVSGTDTMAHMSAALRYMFPNIGLPIITTGAQRSIFEGGSDAEVNLYFALSAAASNLRGVHQAFGSILRHGLHLEKVKGTSLAPFTCPRAFEEGEYDANGFRLYDHVQTPGRNPFVLAEDLEYRPDFRSGVTVIKLSPGDRASSLIHAAKDPAAEALLLVTLGAGNVRDEGLYPGEMTHIEALRIMHQAQYPVVLGSSMLEGAVDSMYAGGAKAVSEGIEAISAGSVSHAALVVKMMIALARSHKEGEFNYSIFNRVMRADLAGESSLRPI